MAKSFTCCAHGLYIEMLILGLGMSLMSGDGGDLDTKELRCSAIPRRFKLS